MACRDRLHTRSFLLAFSIPRTFVKSAKGWALGMHLFKNYEIATPAITVMMTRATIWKVASQTLLASLELENWHTAGHLSRD
jgi:hypothetical protein